jgi:hypothetical protein
MGGVIPLPLSETEVGEPDALCVIVRVPFLVPTLDGANVTRDDLGDEGLQIECGRTRAVRTLATRHAGHG